MATILQQMTVRTTLVQSQLTDTNHLKERETKSGTTDLLSSLRIAVTSAGYDGDEIEEVPMKKKKKKKSNTYCKFSFSDSDPGPSSDRPRKSSVLTGKEDLHISESGLLVHPNAAE